MRNPDVNGAVVVWYPNFSLNMVDYEKKSEIRVTVQPAVVQNTPSHSIMVMRESGITGIDYDIYIYPPGSSEFTNYLAVCNNTMPSGGKTPRRFGWI
jgi:hypothetical protein